MKVPFVDLKAQYLTIQSSIDEAVHSIIDQTIFVGGKPVDEFEQAFANAYGVKHCISCANGTDSLYIIMKMLGIGLGDEVITVANSWISSSETISQVGAKPVFVDIDPIYYSLDENLLEKAITPRTKAVIAVHLHGQMCNITAIAAICKKHGLYLIEDCAQSHFSAAQNQLAGTFGIAGSFSFYPGKNLGAYGDAGGIITNNDELAEKCKMFARHGALKKHQHQIEGINSRLDSIQAAILNVKLPHIHEWTNQRIANAALYTKLLQDVEQVVTPAIRPNTKHTFHLYIVRVQRREELIEFLKSKDIETAIHYPTALPLLKAYNYLGYTEKDFPIAAAYQSQILSLPMYPELTTSQIEYVVQAIKQFYA